MKLLHIIGCDVSKETLDFATVAGQHLKVGNDTDGFTVYSGWLTQHGLDPKETMVVMEDTGFYSFALEAFLFQNRVAYAKVPGLEIKRSLGLVRGKNDRIDALRIARYGEQKAGKLQQSKPKDPAMLRLQLLHRLRTTLVRHKAGLVCTLKEFRLVVKADDPMVLSLGKAIAELKEQIKDVEKQTQALINSSAQLQENFELLKGVQSVGKVLATATIVKTGNFSGFTLPRKFACFCGIAPFEHTSGKSIRGKSRLSHLADKEMKTLLDLAARSAIQYDEELRSYYLNKVRGGKNERSVRNVIRIKILYRMFAVIKRRTPFEKQAPKAA